MRYFKKEKIEEASEIVIYDITMEFILERAFDLLLEKEWNVGGAAKELTDWKWPTEEVFREFFEFTFGSKPEELDQNLIDSGKEWLKRVKYVFYKRDSAINELKRLELVSESNIKNINSPFEMKKSIVAVPCIWHYSPSSFSPAALFVTTILGYAVDLDVGITKGLNNANPPLFKKLVEIWDNAVKKLHPFQRGPTHQGTKHCIKILDNLYSLYSRCSIINTSDSLDSLEKRSMMSIAAAIHDVGKGDILAKPPPTPDYHARNCARLIAKERDIFKLNDMDQSCIKLIGKLVEMHNPEDQTQKIGELGNIDIMDTKFTIDEQGVKMDNLCALFQLADVMDTTKHRVSEPAFRILEHLYPGDSGFYSIEKLINARKGIIDCKVVKSDTNCSIKVTVSKNPDFAAAAKARIAKENDDLKETGAQKTLNEKGWPERLEF